MQGYIKHVIGGADLTIGEARDAAWTAFEDATETQIDVLLAALRARDETEAEIVGFTQGMHDTVLTTEPDRGPLVDTCDTGGSDYNAINVSATSALVAAGTGTAVAKHGNYSVSSSSGSADVLKVADVNAEVEPKPVETCIEDNGIGFMPAPVLHPAVKAVTGLRKELGIRMVFNVLGPLTNPVGADMQTLDIYNTGLVPVTARPLSYIPIEHTLIVHGSSMGGIALHDTTTVAEIDGDEITECALTPVDLDLERAPIRAVTGGVSQEDISNLEGIFTGDMTGPKRDLTLANTGATIYVAGLIGSLEGGVEVARNAIDSGVAKTKHDTLREAWDDPR